MQEKVCPFCGMIFQKTDTTFVNELGDSLIETAVSYIECKCGATYCPERLRVNHARSD